MTTDSGTSAEALIDDPDDVAGEAPASPDRRKRRVRVRVKRERELFPRWVQITLWLTLPVLVWVGAYLIGTVLM